MSATLARWMKFNLVGAAGIVVQFAALFFLKSVLRFDYLFATVLAVEIAVVHNFVWHERYTWADRVRIRDSGTKAPNYAGGWFAALKRCAPQTLRGPSLARFIRFNFTTGMVSIIGNLAMMKLLVDFGQVNYLAANGIAIVLCSLANFLVSDEWVFV